MILSSDKGYRAINFFVPGEVKGQGRPRATVRGGFASVYERSEDRANKHNIQLYAQEAMKKAGYALAHPDGIGIDVTVQVYVKVPKSFSRRKREDAMAGFIMPQRKPDLDNVLKAVLDAMNGVVYADDSAVTHVAASRHYDEAWGLRVMVVWNEDEE